MYVISNKQRDEILTFLAALKDLPEKSNKDFNLKRRAGIAARKLEKAQFINHDEIKNISKSPEGE